MALSRRKEAYLQAHFWEFGDGRLARALDVPKDEVWKARSKLGLGRSAEDNARIKEGVDGEPPRYLASAPLPDWAHGLTQGDWFTALGVFVAALGLSTCSSRTHSTRIKAETRPRRRPEITSKKQIVQDRRK